MTSQFYLADHPLNARDGLYRRLSAEGCKAVEMTLTGDPTGWETTRNIVL